jgi:uncharacterized protein (UPF0335 family)
MGEETIPLDEVKTIISKIIVDENNYKLGLEHYLNRLKQILEENKSIERGQVLEIFIDTKIAGLQDEKMWKQICIQDVS